MFKYGDLAFIRSGWQVWFSIASKAHRHLRNALGTLLGVGKLPWHIPEKLSVSVSEFEFQVSLPLCFSICSHWAPNQKQYFPLDVITGHLRSFPVASQISSSNIQWLLIHMGLRTPHRFSRLCLDVVKSTDDKVWGEHSPFTQNRELWNKLQNPRRKAATVLLKSCRRLEFELPLIARFQNLVAVLLVPPSCKDIDMKARLLNEKLDHVAVPSILVTATTDEPNMAPASSMRTGLSNTSLA